MLDRTLRTVLLMTLLGLVTPGSSQAQGWTGFLGGLLQNFAGNASIFPSLGPLPRVLPPDLTTLSLDELGQVPVVGPPSTPLLPPVLAPGLRLPAPQGQPAQPLQPFPPPLQGPLGLDTIQILRSLPPLPLGGIPDHLLEQGLQDSDTTGPVTDPASP